MQFHSSFIDGAAGNNPRGEGASQPYDDFLLILLPTFGLQWPGVTPPENVVW